MNVDGLATPCIFINSETTLDEYKGKSGFVVREVNNKIGKISSSVSQPSALFSSSNLKSYQSDLDAQASIEGVSNILDTGINIKYEMRIKTENLASGKMLIEFNGKNYDLDSASPGLKILISLAMRGANESISDHVILIDEIENFLHPEWIQIAALLINKLIDNNKIIIATHNPLLLSLIFKKHPEMLSKIKINNSATFGKVITWDYQELKNKVKLILEHKDSFFPAKAPSRVDGKLTFNEVDLYIKALINQETAMMFFWEKPIFVEGATEKIYLEQKYNRTFISVGGFHQFPILNEIAKAINIEFKYIMDTDWINNTKTILPYNEHIYSELSLSAHAKVFRMTNNFDIYLTGSKASRSYEKVPNAIKILNSKEVDPSNEKTNLERFIKS